MARYEDFSVSLLRIGSDSQLATGNPAGASAASNGNARSSSIIYAFFAPGALVANTETLLTSAVTGLDVGDLIIYAPAALTPNISGAVVSRAYCAVAGTLTMGLLSGGTPTPGAGIYRFEVKKQN